MSNGLSFYNEETDSVDIILNSHTTLRLSFENFILPISDSPEVYAWAVQFAEMALDQWLESYLNSSF